MAHVQDLAVVVPCYNEAARFDAERFYALSKASEAVRFVLVDDGSTDATRALLQTLEQRAGARFQVLGLDQNVGKAEAVRRGLVAAFEHSPAFVAYFDADLATPFAELLVMRELLQSDEALQIVLASRVALLGRSVRRSHVRHYLGRVFATAASFSLGLTVYDTQCGAKLFRNGAALRSVFAHPFSTRWTFDVEILARLKALASEGSLPPLERCAAEYPLREWQDVAGSKLRPQSALRAATDLAGLALRYRGGWRR